MADEPTVPTVAFEPCPQFHIPDEGDRLTCGTCGWWADEHDEEMR